MANNSSDRSDQKLAGLAGKFTTSGTVASVRPFGSGNINDTFLVSIASEKESHFILQHINTHVFRTPDLVMKNMRIITEHVHEKLSRMQSEQGRRWEMPRILLTPDGNDRVIGSDGSFWRAMSFINDAKTFDTIQSETHAEEVGFALGMFHQLVSDIPPGLLSDTLEGFHITPLYLSHYDDVEKSKLSAGTSEIEYCKRFIERMRRHADILEGAKAAGRIHIRTMHGDPKINNVMIDTATGKAVGMIDLDTVKPGLVHYDIGDCLRSSCNPSGEETENWRAVRFEPEICRAILRGYLSQAKSFLTPNDYEYIYDAVRLIAFELGLRFFTDYLEGDVYFKSRYEGHNLLRALVQFRLAESIESQESGIRRIVREISSRCS